MFHHTVYLAYGAKAMKIQAWGWLIAGVVALGLNGFYHDGGLAWAHRAVTEFQHNTGAVLALASGRADEFLAEVKPVVVHQETASCRMTTAVARVQSKVQSKIALVQTELAQARMPELDANEIHIDRFLAAQVAASDRLQAMSDRQQAAGERLRARQVQMNAQIAAKMVRLESMPALRYASFETHCPQVRVHIPRVRVPEINVPQIHIPQVQIPQISVPAVNLDGAGPV